MIETLSRCIVLLAACNCLAVAAEPQKKPALKFPARLEVVSSKLLDDGRRELDLKIVLEKDVEVYAKYDGDVFLETPRAKLSLVTTAGDEVPVTVVFPKPNVIEQGDGFGKVYYYAESIRLRATYTPPDNSEDLEIQCKLGGWNRLRSCCLGFHRQIEAKIPAVDQH